MKKENLSFTYNNGVFRVLDNNTDEAIKGSKGVTFSPVGDDEPCYRVEVEGLRFFLPVEFIKMVLKNTEASSNDD